MQLCSVQCAGMPGLAGWRATLQLLFLHSLQVRKTRPGVMQEPYLLLGRQHQLAARKDTSKQRTARSTVLL